MEVDVVRYAIEQNRRPFTPPFRQVGLNERIPKGEPKCAKEMKVGAAMKILDDNAEE